MIYRRSTLQIGFEVVKKCKSDFEAEVHKKENPDLINNCIILVVHIPSRYAFNKTPLNFQKVINLILYILDVFVE